MSDVSVRHIGLNGPEWSADSLPFLLKSCRQKFFRKRHRYVTVLTDSDSKLALDVVQERTQQAAEKLLDTLPESSRQAIEAVAVDMWPAYMSAVASKLPEVSEVFDRSHMTKHLNEAVDKVRRKEHRELTEVGDDTLKQTKYLWLPAGSADEDWHQVQNAAK